jgi:hypothetical protein
MLRLAGGWGPRGPASRTSNRPSQTAHELLPLALSTDRVQVIEGEHRGESVLGIDWAEDHHDVAVVDEAGQLLAKRRIADSAEGFEELLKLLAEVGDEPGDPIPEATETPRGLLVADLRSTGRKVFAINPMAVARYRERHSVARKKSDHVDAMTLAGILRTDAHAHRPLPDDSDLAKAIAVLARAHQDAI